MSLQTPTILLNDGKGVPKRAELPETMIRAPCAAAGRPIRRRKADPENRESKDEGQDQESRAGWPQQEGSVLPRFAANR